MRVRPYDPAVDREKVLALRRAHGERFVFADPDDPLNSIYVLLEGDDGELLAAGVGRVTAEMILLVNHERGTPSERWDWTRMMTEETVREGYNRGLGEMHCWVRPELRSFARRVGTIPGVETEARHSFTMDLKKRYLG